MSTKVKGEAIKEGSIPLSALSSGNNLLKGFIGDSSNGKLLEEDNKNYYPNGSSDIQTIYVKISQIDSLFELKKYNTLKLQFGPMSEIIWDDNGVRIIKLASYYKPIIYANIMPLNPDWNAQEGEAGYIENKPFDASIINKKFDTSNVTGDQRSITYTIEAENDDYVFVAIYKNNEENTGFGNNIGYNYIYYDTIYYSNHESSYPKISTYIPDGAGFGEYMSIQYVEGTGFIVTFESEDEIYDSDLDNISYAVLKYDYRAHVKQINPILIPDTIIKTVPQYLSDAAKNQALANLGIDPVVWKYICNPIILKKDYTAIPLGLVNSWTLAKIPNAYRYIDEDNHQYIPTQINNREIIIKTANGDIKFTLDCDLGGTEEFFVYAN